MRFIELYHSFTIISSGGMRRTTVNFKAAKKFFSIDSLLVLMIYYLQINQ